MAFNPLIVDDSAVMRVIVARVLRMSGLPLGAVYEAANGAEALAAVRAHPVNLVLLDVNMPVMDGEEVLRRLRADPRSAALPVVVVSTEGSEARVQALGALGVGFVRKPFRPETLRAEVLRVAGVTPDEDSYAVAHGDAAAPADGDAFDF